MIHKVLKNTKVEPEMTRQEIPSWKQPKLQLVKKEDNAVDAHHWRNQLCGLTQTWKAVCLLQQRWKCLSELIHSLFAILPVFKCFSCGDNLLDYHFEVTRHSFGLEKKCHSTGAAHFSFKNELKGLCREFSVITLEWLNCLGTHWGGLERIDWDCFRPGHIKNRKASQVDSSLRLFP